MNRMAYGIFLSLVCAYLLAGCEAGNEKGGAESSGEPKAAKPSLVLYNWDDYIGSNTLAGFEKATGIHVTLVTFDTEIEMVGALQSDPSRFDLVVTSEDTARELRSSKLLEPFAYDKIPNFKHIDEKFLRQPWDPQQQYTVPFLTGVTGVVVNTRFVTDFDESWSVLFDRRYDGRQAFLKEPFEALGAMNKALGYSLNETRPEALAHMERVAREVGHRIHGFYVLEELMERLRREEIWLSQIYSGEGMVLADENESLEFFIPEEGVSLWVDMFVMPRGVKHIEEAHAFLDYVLQPEVSAAIASELWYATANKTAVQYVDPEVLASPLVFPTPEILKRCETFKDLGLATGEYNRIWADLQRDLAKK